MVMLTTFTGSSCLMGTEGWATKWRGTRATTCRALCRRVALRAPFRERALVSSEPRSRARTRQGKLKGASTASKDDIVAGLPQMIGDAHVEVTTCTRARRSTTCTRARPRPRSSSRATRCSSRTSATRARSSSRSRRRALAQALTHDQTLYRKDERERVKASGARVLSIGMLEGEVEISDNFDCGLGDEIDEEGDPPRLWLPFDALPGCAFSRSIGDHVAETIGCVATPEILGPRKISPTDRYLVIASDGVWEFLTNKTVINMVSQYSDPLEACHAVVAESYKLWLSREERSDDIVICLFLNDAATGARRRRVPAVEAAAAPAPAAAPAAREDSPRVVNTRCAFAVHSAFAAPCLTFSLTARVVRNSAGPSGAQLREEMAAGESG